MPIKHKYTCDAKYLSCWMKHDNIELNLEFNITFFPTTGETGAYFSQNSPANILFSSKPLQSFIFQILRRKVLPCFFPDKGSSEPVLC